MTKLDAEIREELESIMPQLSQSLIMSVKRLENQSTKMVMGKYELARKIGRGAQGEVWQAKHLLAETMVAIKFLPVELSEDENAIMGIRKEYGRVTKLIHPNIVQYRDFDYDSESKRYFLVMDYVEGITVRTLLMREDAMLFEKAWQLLEPIGAALTFAHEQGIVHCDLKPENILVRKSDKKWLLTDFGLAKEIRNSQTRLSIKVDITGTMPYMSPEQYKGRRPTAETDIWALGVILYEMVAGDHPFYGTSFEHFKDIVCNEEIERLNNLSDSEWNILQKMLAKEKEERISSFAAAWANASSLRIEMTSKKTDDETAKLAKEMEKLQEEKLILQEQITREKHKIQQQKKEEDERLAAEKHKIDQYKKEEEERLAAEKQKFEQMKKEEQERLAAEKHKIEQQKKEEQQKAVKRSQNKPEEIPTEIWRVCWCDDYFDFSQDVWCSLNVKEQIKYATAYQNWYANQQKLTVGKDFVVDKVKTWFGLGEKAVKTTIPLRLIPPGKFWMGSPENEKDRGGDEKRHQVLISKAYYVGETAITQEQWQAVMGRNPSHFKGLQNPVESVSWDNCVEFCNKIGVSLPTEAQWEYACRGGTTTEFNLGSDISANQVNYDGNYPYRGNKGTYRQKTVAVKSLSNKNSWGCYDFHGNVYEWCLDWYSSDYYTDGQTDPQGANSGAFRVLRGGCWFRYAWYCRSSNRNWFNPSRGYISFGFRCSVPLIK